MNEQIKRLRNGSTNNLVEKSTKRQKRNKSKFYSKKLNKLFKEAVKLVSEYPQIGKQTDNKNARIKIVFKLSYNL